MGGEQHIHSNATRPGAYQPMTRPNYKKKFSGQSLVNLQQSSAMEIIMFEQRRNNSSPTSGHSMTICRDTASGVVKGRAAALDLPRRSQNTWSTSYLALFKDLKAT